MLALLARGSPATLPGPFAIAALPSKFLVLLGVHFGTAKAGRGPPVRLGLPCLSVSQYVGLASQSQMRYPRLHANGYASAARCLIESASSIKRFGFLEEVIVKLPHKRLVASARFRRESTSRTQSGSCIRQSVPRRMCLVRCRSRAGDEALRAPGAEWSYCV